MTSHFPLSHLLVVKQLLYKCENLSHGVFSALINDCITDFYHVQANLKINPAALLPVTVPSLLGAVSVLPGTAPMLSEVSGSCPVLTPVGAEAACKQGVSLDTPVQVTTLQSAHKVSF